MDKILRKLYDSFYTPPKMAEQTKAVEANRALLRGRLAAEDRKIVLRIMDALGLMALEQSYDSFLCGFQLAWQISNELNHLDEERSVPADEAEQSVLFLSDEENKGWKRDGNVKFDIQVAPPPKMSIIKPPTTNGRRVNPRLF